MPNPKSKISPEELYEQLYNLSRIEVIYYEGYEYKVDYDSNINALTIASQNLNLARQQLINGAITKENYNEYKNKLDDAFYTYNLIDDIDKICGEYRVDTRNYIIFNKRITINGNLFYCDKNMNLITRDDYYVGKLYMGEDLEMEIMYLDIDTDSDTSDDDLIEILQDE